MKQLEISFKLSQHHEKHTIYLGNSEFLKHKSKTFIKNYVRLYKKVLMDNVRIINSYNAQIYGLYRTFYFDLSTIEVAKVNHFFTSFNSDFNWMFDNIGGEQNSIIFNKINACISRSFDILEVLKEHGAKHKNYSLKNQAESYLKILKNFEEKYNEEKRSLNVNRDYTKSNVIKINETDKKAV